MTKSHWPTAEVLGRSTAAQPPLVDTVMKPLFRPVGFGPAIRRARLCLLPQPAYGQQRVLLRH